MFRKPQDILLSTKTNIRKKEVKELRQRIKYSLSNFSDDSDKALFGNGNDIEMLKLKSSIIIYKQKDGVPIFIETPDKRFYPTVFAMWIAPTIVPVINTNSFVSGKLLKGASLMAPGITDSLEELPKLLNKTVVAICTQNNPNSFAVGYCCTEDFSADMECGKGKVIEIVHLFADSLYYEYCKGDAPEGFTQTAIYPLISDPNDLNNEINENDDEAVSEEVVEEKIDAVKECTEEVTEDKPRREITEREMDDQFLHLAIRCLNAVGNEDLPMQCSTFNSKYLCQQEFINKRFASEYYCGDVSDEKGLNWNKTSFKKLGKFIIYLDEKKLLVSKDVNKQLTIITVNWSHPWLSKYAEYIMHFKSEAVKSRSDMSEKEDVSDVTTTVAAVYKVNRIMRNIFLAMQMDPDALYSMSDAKSILNGYIATHQLIDAENASILNINDELSDALFRDKKIPTEGFAKTLQRKEVARLFAERLIPYHAVQVNERIMVKKGTCSSITITTEKVKGAKSLQTCVHHISDFSIDIKALLKSLSKACASSGCIQTFNDEQYIQLQGKVAPIVKDCLEKEYKIPSKYIVVK